MVFAAGFAGDRLYRADHCAQPRQSAESEIDGGEPLRADEPAGDRRPLRDVQLPEVLIAQVR